MSRHPSLSTSSLQPMASSSEKLQTCFKVQQDHLNCLGQPDGCSPPHRAQGMTQLPRRMPEPILHHEKGRRIHHQGTVNQRASVPFTIFLRFSRCCKPKKHGVSVKAEWYQCVCVCVGCWSPPSWKGSVLSTHCIQLFTDNTDKQGLELGGLACPIRAHICLILRNDLFLPNPLVKLSRKII